MSEKSKEETSTPSKVLPVEKSIEKSKPTKEEVPIEDFDSFDSKVKEQLKKIKENEDLDEIALWKRNQERIRDQRRFNMKKKKVLVKKRIRSRMSFWDLTPEDMIKLDVGVRQINSKTTKADSSLQALQQNSQAKRIYVGSIPNTISEKDLLAFFNAQMITNGLIDKVFGDAVVGCKINYAKSFCFLDLRSESEATKCLQLNGLKLQDCTLRVKRPTDYQAPSSDQSMAFARAQLTDKDAAIADILNQNVRLESAIYNLRKFFDLKLKPTKILVLLNMINVEDYVRDDEYADLKKDILSEIGKYGKVVSLVIPRPHRDGFKSGFGKVFVEYSKASESKLARDKIQGKVFRGRVVVTSFMEPNSFYNKKY